MCVRARGEPGGAGGAGGARGGARLDFGGVADGVARAALRVLGGVLLLELGARDLVRRLRLPAPRSCGAGSARRGQGQKAGTLERGRPGTRRGWLSCARRRGGPQRRAAVGRGRSRRAVREPRERRCGAKCQVLVWSGSFARRATRARTGARPAGVLALYATRCTAARVDPARRPRFAAAWRGRPGSAKVGARARGGGPARGAECRERRAGAGEQERGAHSSLEDGGAAVKVLWELALVWTAARSVVALFVAWRALRGVKRETLPTAIKTPSGLRVLRTCSSHRMVVGDLV